ncbi:MAG: hypothetical protein ACLFVZ_09195, partial [Actinomycetota bacterium]
VTPDQSGLLAEAAGRERRGQYLSVVRGLEFVTPDDMESTADIPGVVQKTLIEVENNGVVQARAAGPPTRFVHFEY